MFNIKINDEFLDLGNQGGELQRYSPLFNADTGLFGEYTTPFNIPWTAKNARLLGLYQFNTKRIKNIYDVKQYDDQLYVVDGKLVLEATDINLNDISKSVFTAYFLTGISAFYKDIKGKKLSDLLFSTQVHLYEWTSSDPDDSSHGFWQHVNAWDDTFDHIFAPLRNEGYLPGVVSWFNGLGNDGKVLYDPSINILAPQIRLRAILDSIFFDNGFWVPIYTGLNDADWEDIFIPSNIEVDWWNWSELSGYQPNPFITVDYKKLMPQKKLISEFLIDAANRYGINYIFDPVTHTVQVHALKEVDSWPVKDWTENVLAGIKSEHNEEAPVFAFKNDIDSKDSYPSTPDFTRWTFADPVIDFASMPTPSNDYARKLIYTYLENKWWKLSINEADELFWELFSDNIYNFEPEGNNISIETKLSTMPVFKTLYKTVDAVDHYGMFPYCKIPREATDFEPRALFYHGLQPDFGGSDTYPALSSLRFVNDSGTVLKTWSDIYSHPQPMDTADHGLIEYWWRKWLDKVLWQSEDITVPVVLTRKELLDYRWHHIILIRGVRFLVKNYIEPKPYNNILQFTLRRIA